MTPDLKLQIPDGKKVIFMCQQFPAVCGIHGNIFLYIIPFHSIPLSLVIIKF